MKITTEQLKQIIKEELETVLNEDLPDPSEWWSIYNGCMKQGVGPLKISAGDEDGCLDLAMQVQSGNYDDDVVMAYARYEYGDPRDRMPPVDTKIKDAEKIDSYIEKIKEDDIMWRKFAQNFMETAPNYFSNQQIRELFKSVYGYFPSASKSSMRHLKRKISRWCRRNNCNWGY